MTKNCNAYTFLWEYRSFSKHLEASMDVSVPVISADTHPSSSRDHNDSQVEPRTVRLGNWFLWIDSSSIDRWFPLCDSRVWMVFLIHLWQITGPMNTSICYQLPYYYLKLHLISYYPFNLTKNFFKEHSNKFMKIITTLLLSAKNYCSPGR